MMTACVVDRSIPLIALPTTTENRDTGATRISFIKPNSLSQMIEIDENMELKRIVIPKIPGKINCVYGTPVLPQAQASTCLRRQGKAKAAAARSPKKDESSPG